MKRQPVISKKSQPMSGGSANALGIVCAVFMISITASVYMQPKPERKHVAAVEAPARPVVLVGEREIEARHAKPATALCEWKSAWHTKIKRDIATAKAKRDIAAAEMPPKLAVAYMDMLRDDGDPIHYANYYKKGM